MNKEFKNFEVNLYYIKSDFNSIALRLCKKLTEKRVLIKLNNDQEMNSLDKFLWTKEKDGFLPHKTFLEKLYDKDKLVLFYGDSLQSIDIEKYEIMLVSPNVQIKKLAFLKKFFLFSNSSFDEKIYESICSKLKNKVNTLKCFCEYDVFKWKLVSN